MSLPSNLYFEEQKTKYYHTVSDNDLLDKITEYSKVVNELRGSALYKIITKDCAEKEKFIDDNWFLITDEKILNNMRVKKNAIKYLLDLEKEFASDLSIVQKELTARKETGTSIIKDYDGE